MTTAGWHQTLTGALKRSGDWMNACATLVDGVAFETTLRARVAVSLHHLCIEHHRGGHVLIERGVRGSAFALYRPQFEAYVRGHWYAVCATDDQLAMFIGGDDPPSMKKLVSDLETTAAGIGDLIRQVKQDAWRSMCAFTHGGAIQVKARAVRDEIRQSFTDEHTGQLLDAMTSLSHLAALGIAAVANDETLANRLADRRQSIFSSFYNRV
ncbi:DUF6988 family protein [Burkholderia ubonensis]|uniref:DUF6988 family protein n=1 Tax=Burkholderia ubonensis TaxID=101571 RepID=UPI000A412155